MRNPFSRKNAPSLADRYSGLIRSARSRPARFGFLRKRRALIALIVLAVLAAGGGYAAYFYYNLQGALQNPDIDLSDPQEPEGDEDPPFNVLLVGSDSRKGLTEEEQLDLGAGDVAGERADTLIIGHIDPETEHVTMVQFPRDLYVPEADGGKSKINETLEAGDVHLIETVEEVTGLDMHHYAKVNIAGFRDLVDAIGGVEVCIADPIPFDPQTGIEVTPEDVGMVEFDGDKALRFVRSRHFETGDFERIQNQQKFLSAAIDKITSLDTFLRLERIFDLRDIAKDNVTIDRDTTLTGLWSILKRFRAFDPANYEAYTVPNLGVGSVELPSGDTASIVEPNPRAMRVMFEALENNESPAEADGVPDVKTSSISISVLNGTAVDGAGESAADEIVAATRTEDGSVDVESVANADKDNYKKTVIVHRDRPDSKEKARVIVSAIPGAKMQVGRIGAGLDVSVIVGKRFKTRQLAQIVPIPIPKPAELPEECR